MNPYKLKEAMNKQIQTDWEKDFDNRFKDVFVLKRHADEIRDYIKQLIKEAKREHHKCWAGCIHNLDKAVKDKVTRIEVIDDSGRSYTNWDVQDIKFSFQDDDRTLKIFVKGDPFKLPKIKPKQITDKKGFIKLAKEVKKIFEKENKYVETRQR